MPTAPNLGLGKGGIAEAKGTYLTELRADLSSSVEVGDSSVEGRLQQRDRQGRRFGSRLALNAVSH